jgi:very-short-patch-repair endonuclease
MSNRNKQFYQEEYVEKERSVYDIADTEGVYPNKITRELHSFGFRLRSKSEAQRAAIKHGRHKHPTKGRARPAEVREKISDSVSESWQNLSDEERTLRSNSGKLRWRQTLKRKRDRFREQGMIANKKTGINGSRLERYLVSKLGEAGYEVEQRPKGGVPIDIFLPRLKIAIQVDGPSHVKPIWGMKKLERQIIADEQNTRRLLNSGFGVLRIKNMINTMTTAQERKVFQDVLNILPNLNSGVIRHIEVF